MNKTPVAVAVAALLSVGLSTTLWADPTSTNSDANNMATEGQTNANIQMAISLNNYNGKEVITSTGDSVGTIDKLVTSNSDHAVYAVVGVGGFLGIGQRNAAIPVHQLHLQGDKWVLSTDITVDSLKKGMKYEKSDFSAFEPIPSDK
jgi:hypothetical protein